jgi:hypothetical protein
MYMVYITIYSGIMQGLEFAKVADARAGFKKMLDAASEGRAATVRREADVIAMVAADDLRRALAPLAPHPEVVEEDGTWSVLFPGSPLAAEGGSFQEAVDDTITVLREYAEDWVDHLRNAANHSANWGFVQFIQLSSDDELGAWLNGYSVE